MNKKCSWLRWLPLAFAVLGAAPAIAQTAPTARDLQVPITITDAGVNAFLSRQYNAAGFPRVLTGTVLGCPYTLSLALPTVTFVSNAARLNMGVTISSTTPACGGPYTTSFSPTIAIPAGQISVAGVRAFLIDLQTKINALPLPAWVRNALSAEYVPRFGVFGHLYNFVMYPGTLLGKLSTPWFDQRALYLDAQNPFALGWSVIPGALVLKPSVRVRSGSSNLGALNTTPMFWARLIYGPSTGNWDALDVYANIKATLREYVVFNSIGTIAIYHGYPNLPLRSYPGPLSGWSATGGKTEWLATTNLGVGSLAAPLNYVVWALFEIDRTFYIRQYYIQVNHVPAGTNFYAWFPDREKLN